MSLQNANDLAREAVSCNAMLARGFWQAFLIATMDFGLLKDIMT